MPRATPTHAQVPLVRGTNPPLPAVQLPPSTEEGPSQGAPELLSPTAHRCRLDVTHAKA